MLRTKDYYRQLPKTLGIPEWEWIGAGDLPYTHSFQKGNYKTGFTAIDCSEKCLTNGDLVFLAKHGMTCDKSRLKALSKECVRLYQKKVG